MKHIESKQKVYETSNSTIFKQLTGNRRLRTHNVRNITESMRKDGWMGAPVIVNEKMEIIDGQNRIQSANDTGTAIPYMIFPGYGIKECIKLNKNSCNWNNGDYLWSWKEQGNPNYEWIFEVQALYPEFSLDDLSALAYNKGRIISQSDGIRESIRDGHLEVDDAEKQCIYEKLDFLSNFTDYWKLIGGRSFIFYNALLYCHGRSEVDDKKLLDKVFEKNWEHIMASHKVIQYLIQFDTLYNAGIKNPSNRIDTQTWYNNEHKRTRH